MARIGLVCAASVWLLQGCIVGMTHVQSYEWTVPTGEPRIYEQLLTAVRAQGYRPSVADPVHGVITFPAQRHARTSEIISFTLQCYSDGYFQLIPAGPRVQRAGDGFDIPGGVGDEYRLLALSLTDVVHPSGESR